MNRTATGPFDVYLSHTAADAHVAQAVRWGLTEAGLSCLDPAAEFAPGDDYADRILRALVSSRAVVTILSPAAVAAPWVLYEAGAARAAGVPIFALLAGLPAADIPPILRVRQAFSLHDGLPQMVDAVRRLPERVSA